MQDCTLICDWFRELVLSSHPIRSKTETNGDLDTHVSPAFNSLFVCLFLFALSLAVCDFDLCYDWLYDYFGFCCTILNPSTPRSHL